MTVSKLLTPISSGYWASTAFLITQLCGDWHFHQSSISHRPNTAFQCQAKRLLRCKNSAISLAGYLCLIKGRCLLLLWLLLMVTIITIIIIILPVLWKWWCVHFHLMCRSQRGQQVTCCITLQLIPWDRVFNWTWFFPFESGWPTSPRGPPFLSHTPMFGTVIGIG